MTKEEASLGPQLSHYLRLTGIKSYIHDMLRVKNRIKEKPVGGGRVECAKAEDDLLVYTK